MRTQTLKHLALVVEKGVLQGGTYRGVSRRESPLAEMPLRVCGGPDVHSILSLVSRSPGLMKVSFYL